ncbi:MAG: ATP-binding cassette domain-containing protein [Campylobacteraceae bacterium]|jgi:ATP-binding cassette subfamily B protein/ATP-binding cassette subfamily C protein|nr:ATP-binding cassette domain-containing protein [Campylobacteraceae bacterium]
MKKDKAGVIQKLRAVLDRKTKIILLVMLCCTILFSVLEMASVSAIMPFVSMASNPDIIDGGYYKIAYDFFGFGDKKSFILYFGVFLVVFYLFRGAYSLLYTYFLNKFAFDNFAKFANKLFQNYLHMPYKNIIKYNSSAIIKTVSNETLNLSFLIQNILFLCSEAFTVIIFYLLLLYVRFKMTLGLTLAMGISVFFVVKIISKITNVQGERRSKSQESFLKLITASFGNFKILKLKGNEKEVMETFFHESGNFAKSYTASYTASLAPRYIIESIGFSVLLAAILYLLLRYENPDLIIPVISMYALALYRMLPGISRMLASYNQIIFFKKSLDIIHKDLSVYTEEYGDEKIGFNSSIVLQNVWFSYNDKTEIIKGISLEIKKGEKVAFTGTSGRGKSTLVDLIMGIHTPTSGEILVDGVPITPQNIRSWRAKTGYIPQDIYLFDGTVGENIMFGSDIDEEKAINALKAANIWDFLNANMGLDTTVGEHGVRLSGGQKQRIGIARALYGNPEILVLDEATSALDNETESKIMNEIYNISKDKTLIIIAHRLSTVERCDRRVKL